MDQFIHFVIENSAFAPWICFGLILLAGLNIPISIDVVLAIAAFLAATTLPKQALALFTSVLLGTYFSAWICYWIGRKAGGKILSIRYFAKILPQKRLNQMKLFYQKYGLLTLLIGRFIPFGFRNCLFVTTGISKYSFLKFMWRDALACLLWTSVCFFSFYHLAQSYDILIQKIKLFNRVIFSVFGVTVIIFFCYKKRRKNHAEMG